MSTYRMFSKTIHALQTSGQMLQAGACSSFLKPFVSCTGGSHHAQIFNLLDDIKVAMLETSSGSREHVPSLPESHTLEVCNYYKKLDCGGRCQFLSILSEELNVDHDVVLKASDNLHSAHEKGEGAILVAESRLHLALIPQYTNLFTQIGRLQGGVKFLVDMRKDLLDMMMSQTYRDNPRLKSMNSSLKEMFSHWFAAGLMTPERVTWQSSCDMMQKISEYEAVHPVRNWADLKRRVGPYRRCFVYTHSSMPREPVVVLHTALTKDISHSIQSIVQSRLGEDEEQHNINDTEDTDKISTAIFYSISSTQRGLQGVDLGNYLIKQVVKHLQAEFPKMHQFSSLSPIPGFREWLLGEIHKEIKGDNPKGLLFTHSELRTIMEIFKRSDRSTMEELRRLFITNDWSQSSKMLRLLERPLLRLCARYLYSEKRRGHALNPVANFHLRNGAVLWRINWLGDVSPRGLTASCGLMVNYRYFLDNTDWNSRRYMEEHHIETTQQVLDLVAEYNQIYTAHLSNL